jgi:thiamine biosynthesis lipoprotein
MTTATETLPGIRRVEHIMGMPIVLDIRDDGVDEAVVEQMFEWLRWVDATFSTFKPDSEISGLNRGELLLEEAHKEVRGVLSRCEVLRVATDGYFDVRRASGEPIDPSGFVKGWGVDRAALLLENGGVHNYAVSAGGDMRLRGRAVPQLNWRVGIQHPLDRTAVAKVIETTELAVATSGAYARGDHVWNPRTGESPRGILSVTVVGPKLEVADAFATAVFAMGPDLGPRWTASLGDYEAMTILADQTILATGGFPDD